MNDLYIMKSKFITTALTCTIVGASLAQTYNQTFAATPQPQISQFGSQGPQGLERFLSTNAK